MAEFSENRHISNLINMSCKVVVNMNIHIKILLPRAAKYQSMKAMNDS